MYVIHNLCRDYIIYITCNLYVQYIIYSTRTLHIKYTIYIINLHICKLEQGSFSKKP